MKKILYMALALSLSGLTGCDDFLNLKPLDKVTDDVLFADVNGAKMLLANLYNKMPVEDFSYNPAKKFSYYGEGSNWVDLGWSLSAFTDEGMITHGSGVGPVSDGYWGYDAIRQVNQFLETLDKISMDDSMRSRLAAEANFIRGYIYFALAKRYGGVPIITNVQQYIPGQIENLYVPRSTESDTYRFILEECDKAIAGLPERIGANEGAKRATRWAALALKSRVSLHAASLAKYWNDAPLAGDAVSQKLVGGMTSEDQNFFYNQCILAGEEIINSKKFALYGENPASPEEAAKNYQNIFQSPDKAASEVIFSKAYVDGASTRQQGHSTDVHFSPEQVNPGFWARGRFSPVLDLIDLYEDYTDDGTGMSRPLITREDGVENDYIADPTKVDLNKPYKHYASVADIFKGKDARLFGSVIVPGSLYKNTEIVIQGGLVKADGTPVVYANDHAQGKDGKTYYSFGGESPSSYSGFAWLGNFDNANYSCSGFLLKKFLQEDKNVQGVQFSSTTEYIDLRLAEIYLNYAEAVVESGTGNADLAKTCLNAVRKRAAHKDEIPLTLDNVLKERRVELAFEGHRYWDLIRRREYHSLFNYSRRKTLVPILDLRSEKPDYIFVRANNYYDERANGVLFQPKSYYRPIPGTSSNRLVQNPEY